MAEEQQDFLAEMIEESTALDPKFPGLLEAARRRRALMRALVAKRKARGLSQTVVAAHMNTSQSAVARLEGQEDAKESMIDRYAAAVGVEVTRTIVDEAGEAVAEHEIASA